jgi:DNA-binding sugar fermentation-stimulating protein
MKLKYKDIAPYRAEQLQKQNNRCALCGDVVVDDAVLDHCHKTGLLRQVLHRGCNSMLGKIENNMPRSKMTIERLEEFAGRLVEYIKTQHTEVLHPTFKIKEPKMGRGRGRGKKPPKR